jgi:hypothetical protein
MPRGRRRPESHPFVYVQVGLFFLAAGVWLVGMLSGFSALTIVAIVLLGVAMALGWLGRRRVAAEEDWTEGQDEGPVEG